MTAPWESDPVVAPWERDPVVPSAAADVAKQIGAGLVLGTEALPSIIPRALGAAGRGVEAGLRYLGLETPDMAEGIKRREELQALIEARRKGGMAQQ